jgi:hypothetical protein
VLLVYFDEPAPEPLSVLNLEPDEPVCIALLLSGTEPQAIAVSRESVSGSNAGSSAGTTGFGTTVLRFLLRDDPECTIAAGSATWSWRRLV